MSQSGLLSSFIRSSSMKKFSPVLLAAVAVVGLSGCGWWSDDDTGYVDTQAPVANSGQRTVDTTVPAPAPAPAAEPEQKAPVSNAEPVFERKNTK
jgi:uncharacterized lipoprotein